MKNFATNAKMIFFVETLGLTNGPCNGWMSSVIPLGRATPTTVVSLNIDWTWGEGGNMFLHVHNIRYSTYTMFVQRAQVKNLTICIIMYNVLYSTQHKFLFYVHKRDNL